MMLVEEYIAFLEKLKKERNKNIRILEKTIKIKKNDIVAVIISSLLLLSIF